MRFIPLLTGLLTLSFCSTAQTAACIRTKDSLYIGTDARSIVKSAGAYYFIADVPLDSMVIGRISQIAGRAAGVGALADSCITVMKPLYTDYFTEIIQKDPGFFDSKVMAGQINRSLGHISLMGFENGRAVLIDLVPYVNKGVKHPVVISFSKDEQPMSTFLGGHEPYKGFVANFTGRGRVYELKKWIAVVSGRYPDGVDTPIDILVLTKKGGTWMRQ